MAWIYLTDAQKNMVVAALDDQPASEAARLLRATITSAFEPLNDEDDQILSIAQDMRYVRDGEVEIDNPGEGKTVISASDDNGAYVMAWVWADFSGTPLDKENQPEEAE